MPDLRDHYLFAGLSEAQLRGLWPYIHARDLPAGQTLFSQDDEATSFFLLEHGAVALYRVSAEGQEKVMRFIQPGQTFAESVMFMADSRYPVHARATQASRVLAIDVAAYLKIMEASFATCRSVLARMTERIQAHWDEIEALSLQNSRYRIVHYLLGLAPATASGDVTITLPARKALIAAQLAVTPETLSRILHALAEDRLIEMQGYRLRIPNVAALCQQIS